MPYVGFYIGMHVLLGLALRIHPQMASIGAAVNYFKSQMVVFYLKLGKNAAEVYRAMK